MDEADGEVVPGENARIAARRAKAREALTGAEQPSADSPRVGLALSGGGVRSATFCFGLLRGLAQRGVLPRIDYLSTVSGGGYTGALFGRLVSCIGLRAAIDAFSRNDSLLLWWVRANGRYLTPAGSRDMGMAVASYLRAWIAIQLEVGVACIALGVVALLPHLIHFHTGFVAAKYWSWALTPWWALAALVWLLLAPGAMAAFWLARDPRPGPPRRESLVKRWGMTVVVAALSVLLFAIGIGSWKLAEPVVAVEWMLVPAAVLASAAIQQVLVLRAVHPPGVTAHDEPSQKAVAKARNQQTRNLRLFTGLALIPVVLGALDLASWTLMTVVLNNQLLWSGVGLGGLVLALRVLAEPMQMLAQKSDPDAARRWVPIVLNALGLLAVLVLVLGWLAVLQAWVFNNQMAGQIHTWPAWWRAAIALILALAWMFWTGGNTDMPNASSLHGFYRARLTRAYLSVGNPQRFDSASSDGVPPRWTPASPVSDPAIAAIRSVTDVLDGDDVPLSQYRPEDAGGPIHLVSTCLNQTRDDASKLYNADRKGTLVTATAQALEIGPRGVAGNSDAHAGTLGRWVAMSGAAAAPGAGSYTATGLALLLSLLGVRLGYWMPRPGTVAGPAESWGWRFAGKQVMLGSEAVARFVGKTAPWWYLSDGGHFENTGVYPLIKRELDFIVLADCAADPDYRFADIENLIRKARIDFDAEIEFYTHADATRLLGLPADGQVSVLSPEDVADNYSARGVMLARICYHRSDPARSRFGTLLVVKPNLHQGLDVDLLGYAGRNASFPQQGTGDQFFDEAQWESYHRLGEDFGRALDATWLERLPGWSKPVARDLAGSPAPLRAPSPVTQRAEANVMPWRKSARAAAIGATLGVGASGTLLLSLWQVFDQIGKQRSSEAAEVRQMFVTVSDELRKFDGQCTVFSENAAWQLKRLRDRAIGGRLDSNDTEAVARLVGIAREECEKSPGPSNECTTAVRRNHVGGICDALVDRATRSSELTYLTRAEDRPQPYAEPWRPVVVSASSPPPSSTVVPPPPPPSLEPASPLPACVRDDAAAIRVYMQIYDEASRPLADELRVRLREGPIVVPGIEDVTRTAQLRNQRTPYLWAAPTLIVHVPKDRGCAEQIARMLAPSVRRAFPQEPAFSIRALPKTQRASAGVIELWLPRADPSPAGNDY